VKTIVLTARPWRSLRASFHQHLESLMDVLVAENGTNRARCAGDDTGQRGLAGPGGPRRIIDGCDLFRSPVTKEPPFAQKSSSRRPRERFGLSRFAREPRTVGRVEGGFVEE